MASVGSDRISLRTTNGGVTLTLPEIGEGRPLRVLHQRRHQRLGASKLEISEQSRRRLEGKSERRRHRHRAADDQRRHPAPLARRHGTDETQQRDRRRRANVRTVEGPLKSRDGERRQGHPLPPPEAAGERHLAFCGPCCCSPACSRPGRASGCGTPRKPPPAPLPRVVAARRGRPRATSPSCRSSTSSGSLPLGLLQRVHPRAPLRSLQRNAWRVAARPGEVVRHRPAAGRPPRPLVYWLHSPLAGSLVAGGRLRVHAADRRPDQSGAGAPPAAVLHGEAARSRDALRTRLLALAERAGARVLGAYEWGLGDKTKKANAALAGLGRHAAHPGVGHDARRVLATTRSRSCSRTRSRITCTATSGRGSCSRAC